MLRDVALNEGELTGNSSLQKATWEPAELAQGSPRPESEEELLSTGGEHEDDGTATALCPGKVRPSGSVSKRNQKLPMMSTFSVVVFSLHRAAVPSMGVGAGG